MRIVDMHCDTISSLLNDANRFKASNLRQNDKMIDLLKLQQSNYLVQCFAMFIKYEDKNLFKRCNQMIDRYYYELNNNNDLITPVFSYNDIINNSKIGALLTIEESAVIENDISNLEHFYNRGVRMMTLTWNYENGIGNPNYIYENMPNYSNGLTSFGYEVIKKMEELGIIIDVSHLGDKGFYDVLNNTTRPFVASHSNSRSICSHVRNLTDDMIKRMNERGCLIGINFYADFLSNKGYGYVKDVVRHIKHIKKIGSIDIIALGSDFDGISDNTEIKDASYIYLLIKELEKNDFSHEEIEKICYKNFLNFVNNYENEIKCTL